MCNRVFPDEVKYIGDDKMNQMNRKRLADGVYFNSVKDDRFKTMRITANIIVPLSAETASANALLLGVLSRSCAAYPDFTSLSRKLFSLYGADIAANFGKAGDRQVLSLSISGLDDRYSLDGESISRELTRLLCEVIFSPNLKDNAFIPSEVEQERRQLLDLIDSEFNDKRSYANSQLVKNMFGSTPFGVKRYGTAEAIKAVTPASLYDTWKQLLGTAHFEIMYIGDSSPDMAESVITEAFSSYKRTPAEIVSVPYISDSEEKTVVEEMELSQSKLVMGFRSTIALPSEQVYAMSLMSAVLGGTASSKLFLNVREKQSLCYYCASRYEKHKGVLYVDSGVESANIEKAREGILKEIEDMKNGEISEFELNSAKLAMINAFNSSNDSIEGIETWYGGQLFNPEIRSIEELSEIYMAITEEDIVAAANTLTLDTVFVLKSK